ARRMSEERTQSREKQRPTRAEISYEGQHTAAFEPLTLCIPGVCIAEVRVFELFRDGGGQTLWRSDTRERPEAEYPAVQRLVDTTMQVHNHACIRLFTQPLRGMPLARFHIVGNRRLKFDLHRLRRAGVYAHGMRKCLVGQFLDRGEAFFE